MSMKKNFEPAAIEAKWSHYWEEQGLYRPHRPEATAYTIVNPPPNVTGALHIGHALDNTLQDVLIRYERLRGKDALWVVGTDHAGIATQMIVERQLAEQQKKRTDFTRDAFVSRIWEWKRKSGGQITRQLRRLGCSMDWSREQFTMDAHFTKAVTKVFVDLYRQGLLYRDKRLVNWDPGLKTAISDLEVETSEVDGKFWHFRYPLENGVTLADGRDYIMVATTRPETMLADMAVAVHPDDERYQSVIGKRVKLPITGRLVPIIADQHADPALGSGAVKITPGHDFNDFEVGKRAAINPLDMLNMFDGEARVRQTCDGLIPSELLGLDRFIAREHIVALIDAQGLLERVEDRVIQIPFGDRSGKIIEPWLTDQWYVDAATLAQPAIAAVHAGDIKIIPETWKKTWFNWLENIQPWCVSRQIWWGHRIPVWYGPLCNEPDRSEPGCSETNPQHEQFLSQYSPDSKIFVAYDEQDMRTQAREYYGENVKIILAETHEEAETARYDYHSQKVVLFRDPDVLDTWFSSALWPFATLGWPEEAADSPETIPNPAPETAPDPAAETAPDPAAETIPDPAPETAANPSRSVAKTKHTTTLLERHYPGDVLVSGFDILFFWDARMAMQGLHFMKDVPWRTLYLHGLVRAPDGRKMSKSKGNIIDPLELIERYGADALRFFMCAMESQGRDIKMDDSRLAGYRNFATKLWNAARFCRANAIEASHSFSAPPAAHIVNRWILGEVNETIAAVDKALAEFRFDEAANILYHFVWDRFCDWYLELIKGAIDDETRAVAGWVFDQILVLLHPFMPFVTEELWSSSSQRVHYPLITARWPEVAASRDITASTAIDWLIKVASEIRATKAELGLSPGLLLTAHFPSSLQQRVEALRVSLKQAGRLSSIRFDSAPAGASAQLVVEGETIIIPLAGIIDLVAERERLSRARSKALEQREVLSGRLANPSFVARAKPEAVDKTRSDRRAKTTEVERLTAALARLDWSAEAKHKPREE